MIFPWGGLSWVPCTPTAWDVMSTHIYSIWTLAILFVQHTGDVQGLFQPNHSGLLHLTGGKHKHLLSDFTLNSCSKSQMGIKDCPQILLHVLHILVFLFSRTSISQFLVSSQPCLHCCPVTSKYTHMHIPMFSVALFTWWGDIRSPQNMVLYLPTTVTTTSHASLSMFSRSSS